MFSTLCRTVLHINHYKVLLVNIEELQADSTQFNDYIMDVNKLTGSNSPSSLKEHPKSPSTIHSDFESIDSFDEGQASPSQDTTSTEQPPIPRPDSDSTGPFDEELAGRVPDTTFTETPLSAHHLSETEDLRNSDLQARKAEYRLSRFNPDRSFLWSDQEGDDQFRSELRRWSRDAERVAVPMGSEHQNFTMSTTSTEQSDSSLAQVHPNQTTVEESTFSGDEMQTWTDVSLQEPSVPSPWVEDYHDRMATSPTKSGFEDMESTYEAWSPGKPIRSLFDVMESVDYDIDLPDDLPKLQRFDSKQSTNQQETNNINQALLDSEPLHFLPLEHEMTEQIDKTSASAMDIPAVVVHPPTNEQDAPPDEAQDADEDDWTEEDLRMLYIQVLRNIVASEGGLATLPDVINDDDDEEDGE